MVAFSNVIAWCARRSRRHGDAGVVGEAGAGRVASVVVLPPRRGRGGLPRGGGCNCFRASCGGGSGNLWEGVDRC